MALNDPLFPLASQGASSRVRPWWWHPAPLILGLILLAAALAWWTGPRRTPRQRGARVEQVEIPFEVQYDDEVSDMGEAP